MILKWNLLEKSFSCVKKKSTRILPLNMLKGATFHYLSIWWINFFKVWCKSRTRTPGPLDPGTRDLSQSLNVGPGTPLKFKKWDPRTALKIWKWPRDTLQSLKVGPQDFTIHKWFFFFFTIFSSLTFSKQISTVTN